ncbi:protein shank [Nematostella vectensis]|uniref:protein shank n=1 Tax=Nematostella vectensis TaxID=45351 RepID=UPI002077587C|nr:protein shank [Nematostella vectensis]
MLKFAVNGYSPPFFNAPEFVPSPPGTAIYKERGWDELYGLLRGSHVSLCCDYYGDAGFWYPGCDKSLAALEENLGRSLLIGESPIFGNYTDENNKENSEKYELLQDLLELLSEAQGKRMEDQREEKDNFELPDFLRQKPKNKTYYETEDDSEPLPSPPPVFRMESLLFNRPAPRPPLDTPPPLPPPPSLEENQHAKTAGNIKLEATPREAPSEGKVGSPSYPLSPRNNQKSSSPSPERQRAVFSAPQPPVAPPPPPIGNCSRIQIRSVTRPVLPRRSSSTHIPPSGQLDLISELKGTLSRRKLSNGNKETEAKETGNREMQVENSWNAINDVDGPDVWVKQSDQKKRIERTKPKAEELHKEVELKGVSSDNIEKNQERNVETTVMELGLRTVKSVQGSNEKDSSKSPKNREELERNLRVTKRNQERNVDHRKHERPVLRRVGDCKRINVVRPRVQSGTPVVRNSSESTINSEVESKGNTGSDTIRTERPQSLVSPRDIIASTENIRQISEVGGMGRTVAPVRANAIIKYTTGHPHRVVRAPNTHQDIAGECPVHRSVNTANTRTKLAMKTKTNPSRTGYSQKRRPRTITDPTYILRVIESSDSTLPESRVDSPISNELCDQRMATLSTNTCTSPSQNLVTVKSSSLPQRLSPVNIRQYSPNFGRRNSDHVPSQVDSSRKSVVSFSPDSANGSDGSINPDSPTSSRRQSDMRTKHSSTGSPLPRTPSPPTDEDEELDMANYPPPLPLEVIPLEDELLLPHTSLSPNGGIDKKPPAYEIKYIGEVSLYQESPFAPQGTQSFEDQTKPATKLIDSAPKNSQKGPDNVPQLDPYVTYESENLKVTFV